MSLTGQQLQVLVAAFSIGVVYIFLTLSDAILNSLYLVSATSEI